MFDKIEKPQLMGILNITPDSFSDGGKFLSVNPALDHARKMIKEGVLKTGINQRLWELRRK